MESRDLVAGIVPSGEQKKMSSGFWRVKLGGDAIENHADVLAKVVIATIDRMPKEWDCCSRYLECSDAKHCVHPDPAFALGCGYRKILNPQKSSCPAGTALTKAYEAIIIKHRRALPERVSPPLIR